MVGLRRVAACALLLLMGSPSGEGAQGPGTEEQRSLVVTYSDGKVSRRLLTARGGAWTPNFPRRRDAPGQDGLPLAALQVDHKLDGQLVTVTISLLYGRPHQKNVVVAVRQVGSEPVTVSELEAFGVDPITLAIGAVAASLPIIPATASSSSKLDVSIEQASERVAQYTLVVRNDSDRAVMAYAIRMFRNGTAVGSGRHKTERNTPLITPGDTYRRVLPVTSTASSVDPVSGDWLPAGFDRIEITSVLWDDGVVEGEPDTAASEEALAAGRRLQLRRVLDILRRALAGAVPADSILSDVRASAEALPVRISDDEARALHGNSRYSTAVRGDLRQTVLAGMQQVKTAVLADLNQLESAGTTPGEWVRALIVSYEAWLARVTQH